MGPANKAYMGPANKAYMGPAKKPTWGQTKFTLVYVLQLTSLVRFMPARKNSRQKITTVEPPNKGHFGTSHFVHYREVVLFSVV